MKQTKIVTISSSKGGAGKTTTAMCIADYWASLGNKVGFIDTDPNKSSTRWYEKGKQKGYFENFLFKQELNDKEIIASARNMIGDVDILLIDVAGIASVSLLKAAGIADLVVIPAQPSEDDFVEALSTSKIVREAEELTGRKIPFRTVLTRGKARTSVLEHVITQLEKINFPMFKTVIYDRTIYAQSRFNGATPVSEQPSGDASRDIRSLAYEIEELLSIEMSVEEEASEAVAA